MFIFGKKNKAAKYDSLREYAMERMKSADSADECREWAELIAELDKLEEHEKRHFKHPSPDTVLQVLGSLAGVALICSYEHLHVLATKALPFVLKIK